MPALTEAYAKVITKDKSVIVKLMHWIEKYPDIPQFKNCLCLYYALSGDNEKAFEINNQLLEQFPDYLYAKINSANFYIHNNEPEKVPEVLGAGMELCELYPERKIFHHEEFFNFFETAGQYYCKIKEYEKAEVILENLNETADLLDIDIDFEKLGNAIFLSRVEKITSGEFKKSREPLTIKEKPTLPQTNKLPVFHYPQISWLYQYNIIDMPEEKIHEMLSLEKEWLRIDLETAVYDAIRRYKFFEKDEYDNNETDFCLHALYLLKEIKAEESLDAVLELLRQPQELLDFWLFDALTDNIWQVIYALGFNQTHKLAEFLKEPLNYTFSRTEVSVALTQIILHHPERKQEIVSLYKNGIDFFISNKTDKTIIDEEFIGLMIGDIAEVKVKELLPGIKTLFDEEMADESISGDIDEVKNLMNKMTADDETYKQELQNYFEIKAEWENLDDDEEISDDEEDENEYYDDWEEVKKAEEDNEHYFYSGDKPFVRTVPKVGRNEPCPCGSGKKYKNCHGNE